MSIMKTLAAATAMLATVCCFAAEKPQVIPPERVANYWLLLSGSAKQVNAPNSGRNLDAPSCAAVAYTVEKDGSTSNVALRKVVPEGDLGKVAVSVVQEMQFAPAPQNIGKTPVSTYVVMPFNLPSPNSTNPADIALRQRTLDACQLESAGAKETVIPVR
jgi:hypothetical protein